MTEKVDAFIPEYELSVRLLAIVQTQLGYILGVAVLRREVDAKNNVEPDIVYTNAHILSGFN